MVLVAMCDQATDDLVFAFEQVVDVGQDRVDARFLFAREKLTAVQDQQSVVGLDGCTIAANVSKASEEGNGYLVGHDVFLIS